MYQKINLILKLECVCTFNNHRNTDL